MKIKNLNILMVLLGITFVVGCGSGHTEDSIVTTPMPVGVGQIAAEGAPIEVLPEVAQTAPWAGDENIVSEPVGYAPSYEPSYIDITPVTQQNRRIRRSSSIWLATTELQDTLSNIREIASANSGYVESSNFSSFRFNDHLLASGYYILRVPVQHFDRVNEQIQEIAKVESVIVSNEDMTSQFNDSERRLVIRRQEEERILYMLGNATEIEDILEIEGRLSNIRLVIEQYIRRMSELDYAASFSTITVVVNEVLAYEEEPDGVDDDFVGVIANSLNASFRVSLQILQGLIIVIAALSVPLALIGIGFASYFVIKKRKKVA
jgi:hypothetical protein